MVFRGFAANPTRPDLTAVVTSGLFDLCIEAVEAVEAAGSDGLRDTNITALDYALKVILNARTQPGCEAKIRGAAGALSFCLNNPRDCIQELGYSTHVSAGMSANLIIFFRKDQLISSTVMDKDTNNCLCTMHCVL